MITNYGNYPELKKVKKVLVIKLRNLGDVLLTTPVFHVLKKCSFEVDAYIYNDAFSILSGNENISDILTYDKNIKKLNPFLRLKQEWKILKKIKNKKYDLIINLTEGDRGAIACYASSARYKIGYKSNAGMKGKNNIYTHFIKECPSRHMVEKNLDALRKIGLSIQEEDKKLFFNIPQEAKDNVESILKKHAVQDFILVHPSSKWRFKCYPINKMKKVIDEIGKNNQVVISAGKEDFELNMAKQLENENTLNLAGKLSLKELAALINRSSKVLCVDSLPLHITSSLKKNCLCIFGPTNEKIWGPWQNPNAKIIKKNYTCRPCSLDGCGGSKVSDCLNIDERDVIYNLKSLK